MSNREYLFMAGLARSGTTAITQLFTAHPSIALGMERYKGAFRRRDHQITPAMFERRRFFDFDDELTNIRPDVDRRWRLYYDAIESRWDDARYVGDKVPGLNMRRVWASLPEAKFVCIIRDVHDVAASWEARAANDRDTQWSHDLGAGAAVPAWNVGLRKAAVAHREHPDLVALVEYRRLFADPEASSARAVLDWLGLSWAPAFEEKFRELHHHYVTDVAPKQRSLTDQDRAQIEQHAHLRRWERVLTRVL